MTVHARGTFDVDLKPLEGDPAFAALGRLSIDKQFHGDLEATSRGQMLSALTGVEGSAGYVAIERVSGVLHGKRGAFLLQHHGIMAHGAGDLIIVVIPDSGTEELAGLAGTMTISIIDGQHSYDFAYSLPAAD